MKHWKIVILLVLLCCLLAACQRECIHDYDAAVTAKASCAAEGTVTYTCSLCDHTYTEAIPKEAHTFDGGVVTQQATCGQEGVLTYTCMGCKTTKTEPVARTEHTLGEAYCTKEPNCTEEGQMGADCAVCGQTVAVDTIPTNDVHDLVNQVIQAATCTTPGTGEDVCTRCGYSQSCEYAVTDHDYGSGVVTREATCAQAGERLFTCSMCAQTLTESISALPHQWEDAGCYRPRMCEVCGYYDSVGHGHEYVLEMESDVGEYFAGYRQYECTYCYNRYREYYGKNGRYNISGIEDAIGDYAEAYGFQVITSNSHTDYPDWENGYRFDNVESGGGSSYLISQGKRAVERVYDGILERNLTPSECTLWVVIEYTQSGALGAGYFNIEINVTP